MRDPDRQLEEETGIGTDQPVTDAELEAMKTDLQDIAEDIGTNVLSQRTTNSETRLCQWDGQSDDGRKRKTALGREAFPFEGASDTRVRLADKIINEHKYEFLTAATRSTPRVMGTESNDEAFAARITMLVKWLIKSQWGPDFLTELELLSQWMEGDTPAVAVLGVFWREELAVAAHQVTRAEVMNAYLERMAEALDGEEAADELLQEIQAILTSPARLTEAAALLGGLYPNLTPKRAKAAARTLAETGTVDIPMPYVRKRVPEIEALRLYEDIFFRSNVKDINSAPRIYLRRWLTRSEVREWAERDDWAEDFVKEMLGKDEGDKGKEGISALNETSFQQIEDITKATTTTEARKGLYEVFWCYSRGVLSDGTIGIFARVFSGNCKTPATERRLLEDNTGRYPFVAFARERLTRRLVDSRSVSELVMTQQNSLKLIADSVEDHVQVLTNPPIVKPRGSPRYQLCLSPFGEIEANPRDNVKFLDRPPYPAAAEKHRDYVQWEVDDYFGRENQMVPETRSLLARQARVNSFLANLSEALMIAVQLCQRYMADEDVQRVAGTTWAARTVNEIQGRFDLHLSFDVRDLDAEYLVKKGEMIMKYARPLDSKGTVPWEMYVRNILEAVDPNWADIMPPPDAVAAKVQKDEQQAYMMIMTGIEPPMPEKIDGPQLRMNVIAEAHRPRMQNPQAFPPISLISQAMLQNRVKYLEQQATQERNAVIGRVGAEPVDVEEVTAEMQPGGMPA